MNKALRKLWYFIWEDNSPLSWALNVVLAFILIKFLVYPGLGFALSTQSPVVAVVSESMEHNGDDFDTWWEKKERTYAPFNITKSDFAQFPFRNGFNKGDLMILRGEDPPNLKPGDVIVFRGGESDPIIHRLVTVTSPSQGQQYVFATQGDNNNNQLSYEKSINSKNVIGKAVLRIPLLGYVKIVFTDLVGMVR